LPTDQNEHPALERDYSLPDSPPHGSKVLRVIVWLVLLAVFAVGFVLVLRQHDDTTKAAKAPRFGGGPVSLTTTTAQKGQIGVYLDSIGTVTPVYTASITSQVNGIVTGVHYTEGQLVRKGDPLLDIDPRPYEATLLQAQGTLDRDENILAQAKMDLERYKDAWARNAIPKQTLDDQEKIVLQNQGTVKLDEGTVQYDKIQVEWCHIAAPITGRVGLRLVDPGNVVQSSSATTLVVITQLQPITVVFTIPEDNLDQVQQRLRKGAKLKVVAFDRAAQKMIASGVLLTLDNLIDTTTGTVKGRGSFENKDLSLFPNEFVNVRLLVDTHDNVTLIPASAIQHNGQTAFVYVLQDNTAHMKTIKQGVTDLGLTEVSGIEPGDVLANSSFDKLQDNSKVYVAQTGGGAGGPAGTGGSAGPGNSGGSEGQPHSGKKKANPAGSTAP
jgi:membrane fusion protein, multidrug efflux system